MTRSLVLQPPPAGAVRGEDDPARAEAQTRLPAPGPLSVVIGKLVISDFRVQYGYFHPEDPAQCDEYVDCVAGVPTAGKCSTGVVWSPSNLACTLPAQSGRPECVAAVVKEFTCPKVGLGMAQYDNALAWSVLVRVYLHSPGCRCPEVW